MLCPSPFEFLFLELCFNDPFRINAAWMLSFAISFLLLWIELRSNFLSSQEFNFKYFCRTLCSLTNDIQCCSSLVIFCYLFWISEISLFVKIIGFVIHKLPLLLRIHKAAWEVNDNTPRKCQMPEPNATFKRPYRVSEVQRVNMNKEKKYLLCCLFKYTG